MEGKKGTKGIKTIEIHYCGDKVLVTYDAATNAVYGYHNGWTKINVNEIMFERVKRECQ